jgi:hypothetical protein
MTAAYMMTHMKVERQPKACDRPPPSTGPKMGPAGTCGGQYKDNIMGQAAAVYVTSDGVRVQMVCCVAHATFVRNVSIQQLSANCKRSSDLQTSTVCNATLQQPYDP